MKPNTLLLEVLAEELPPKSLQKLGDAFAALLFDGLKKSGLCLLESSVKSFATPRRLAAEISYVLPVAPDKTVQQKLMPVAIAFDASGQPTPALLKKLTALGADAAVIPTLRRENDGKAEVLFYDALQAGDTLAAGLQKALDSALSSLPIPKVMRYQLADGWTSVDFVRPVHGLVALYGSEIVSVSALGLTAGRKTKGHRFEARLDPVVIADATDYADTLLQEGAVIVSFPKRRADIVRQLAVAAAKFDPPLHAIQDDALLDEVTALVERPNVLAGTFDAAFLVVPPECLILTMKANQKYFPLLDAAGKLSNRFLIVSNLSPTDTATIIEGNERVVRPRLADAKFFFDQDRKKSLASRLPQLDKVVYHNQLGSQGARKNRVVQIAQQVARSLNEMKIAVDMKQVEEAAKLAKADLLSDMVGEFPELQGIMGRYYARSDGLPAIVAEAIEDHYKPRFAGDNLPQSLVGKVLALADKLETLVGLFGIGQLPTGDKDPFALRRHAIGVNRLLMEGELPLPLSALLNMAAATFSDIPKFLANATLLDFLYERLAGSLRDQGIRREEVDAVLSLKPDNLTDISRRLAAVKAFVLLPESASLAAANKRVGNILKKSATAEFANIQPDLFQEAAEKNLYAALKTVQNQVDAALKAGNDTAALCALAALHAPVDAFFEQVMVHVEDVKIKENRLALLFALQGAMNKIADISVL